MKVTASLAMILLVGTVWAQDSQKPADKTAQGASQKSADKAAQDASATLPELKTQKFKGTLMDASCAGSASAAPAKAEAGATDQKAAKSSDQSSGCTVSANTKEFVLRTKDGQTYHFDAVGNDRAAETFKSKKKWNDLSSAGKPITATVSANQSGDTFTVLSVD